MTLKEGPVKGWKRKPIYRGKIIKIPLTRGMFTIIDRTDAEIGLSRHWQALRARKNVFYAAGARSVLLHRLIVGLEKGDSRVVDHINRKTLDNRRHNLRVCESRENLRNTPKSIRNTSGFKGVSWDASKKRWYATICLDNKRIALGRFKTAREAAKAYNKGAIKYHGEFACLNQI